MKLSRQLLLAPLLMAAAALLTGAASTALHEHESRAVHALHEADLQAQDLAAAARQQLADVHARVYRTQAIADSMSEAELQAFDRAMGGELDSVQAMVDTLVGDARTDEQLGQGLGTATAQIGQYRKQVGKALELTSVEVNMGVAAMKSAEASFGELRQTLQQVLNRQAQLKAEQLARTAKRGQWLNYGLAALGGLVTLAALAYGWRVQQRIVAEIQHASAVSRAVAQGRLDQQIGSTRNDELGELLRSTGSMVDGLRDSLQTVRQATDSIRTAAEEIASGNQDLSRRTERAAGNLQQTASSMSQLTSTVAQTADSARNADALAASASQVAQQGGQAVQQVVQTMGEISSSSQRIGQIIGTIDGIAFQTNILALNAAVEAARAGEQGRGFAVVAGEVRSLAQRSAEAAREIKTLVQASVEKVEGGSRQVQAAGDTMGEIVASVKRVSAIIGEISQAAGEQSSGIGQVHGAVGQLDQMTQQNAALVEQSAAAAESLKEQAARLGQVLARFELGAMAGRH